MTTDELAKLTPEQKRIRIAELCPEIFEIHETWRCAFRGQARLVKYITHKGDEDLTEIDPLNDLNAMHEAVETCKEIRARGVFLYVANLVAVLKRDMRANAGTELFSHEEWLGCCIFATAAQRADAFLLTLG